VDRHRLAEAHWLLPIQLDPCTVHSGTFKTDLLLGQISTGAQDDDDRVALERVLVRTSTRGDLSSCLLGLLGGHVDNAV